MAPDLEMGAGSGTGVGFGFPIDPFFPSPPSVSAAATNSYLYDLPLPSSDAMRVDDLLDFSTHTAFYDSVPPAAPDPQHYYGFPQQHELAPASSAALDAFPFDLRIPSKEEAAELEWLSRFVEDSFSIPSSATTLNPSATVANPNVHCNIDDLSNYSIVDPSVIVHGRPWTKRTRPAVGNPAIPTAWTGLTPQSPSSSSSSSSEARPRGARKDRDAGEGGTRKCTHCASEKTPQWRTGPLGPKTLCNACGVRYKSGRLVPEYRPAASPTFVLTKHSNSHRKVMELRRQKEMLMRHQQAALIAVPSGGTATGTAASSRPDMLLMDYEVC